MVVLYIFIILLWAVLTATMYTLERRRPWQVSHREKTDFWFIKRLEEVRHSLQLAYVLASILAVTTLVLWLSDYNITPLYIWTLLFSILGLLVIRQQAIQTALFTGLLTFVARFGRYVTFIATTFRATENVAARLFPEQPHFQNRQELTHLVQHHHQTHKILSFAEQHQIDLLLKADTRPIRQKVIPLKEAKVVKAEDSIGPLLLSELHDSPYASFPVIAKRRSKIVGILDQGVAVSHATKGAKVATIMEERIVYLRESTTYAQALTTFTETSSAISVIIDSENEPVGVLYVQDILRDLFGTEHNDAS